MNNYYKTFKEWKVANLPLELSSIFSTYGSMFLMNFGNPYCYKLSHEEKLSVEIFASKLTKKKFFAPEFINKYPITIEVSENSNWDLCHGDKQDENIVSATCNNIKRINKELQNLNNNTLDSVHLYSRNSELIGNNLGAYFLFSQKYALIIWENERHCSDDEEMLDIFRIYEYNSNVYYALNSQVGGFKRYDYHHQDIWLLTMLSIAQLRN